MPYTTQSSDFWGWYLRHNNRVVWKHLADAGIDVFASGPSNDPQAFLDLTNLLPAMSEGLNRRWGLTPYSGSETGVTTSVIPTRTFVYNVPQDQSNPANTATTNVWFATDDQNFKGFLDNGTAYSGYAPSNFGSPGTMGAVTSRNWFYYGNGTAAPRKVYPGYTTANTDSLMGIAMSCASPGSVNYQDYPCVLIPASGSGGHAGTVGLDTNGTGYMASTVYGVTGGSGTGMTIYVTSVAYGGRVNGYNVVTWGTGYALGNVLTLNGGGSNCTFTVVQLPTGSLGSGSGGTGLGYTPSTSFTVNCSDVGSGTGGVITCFTDANGAIYKVTVTGAGSGYTQAYATLPTPTGTNAKQGYVVLYTQTNASAGASGTISGADVAGPMSFVSGRQWAVALQSSLTGHTSDVFVTQLPYGPTTNTNFNTLTSAYESLTNPTLATLPTYLASQNQVAGFTQVNITISVPSTGLDPQVDTVLLLAASDGGSLGTLYQVATFPLSQFTLAHGLYTLQYYDSTPDSFNSANNLYSVPLTLLAANTWAYTDSSGDTYGILLNTPPTAAGFLYPVLHQGRMFATDGKTVFFSKSLDEVTTTTGLITSKWEECWPADNQLPVALNNEVILGLKSDGTNLHIGTDKSIFTLYGSDPSNFSVPSTAFAQTGILSNDCWSVIYTEGQPSGFVWITQDLKVIHSDFSTYREIGTPIYKYLSSLHLASVNSAKVLSLTQGPYNFVILQFSRGLSQSDFWIMDTRLQKWFHWTVPTYITTLDSAFVYQIPIGTNSSYAVGSKYLMFWQNKTGPAALVPWSFQPNNTQDLLNGTNTPITWSVQTSWQDSGDSTAIKVINEIEMTTDEAPLTVTLYGATSQAQFDSGGTVLKTGPSVSGPLASLGTNKFYCAGTPTGAKYHSVSFTPVTAGTNATALTSFSWEYYPMARI